MLYTPAIAGVVKGTYEGHRVVWWMVITFSHSHTAHVSSPFRREQCVLPKQSTRLYGGIIQKTTIQELVLGLREGSSCVACEVSEDFCLLGYNAV
jgi:hypothetical protein